MWQIARRAGAWALRELYGRVAMNTVDSTYTILMHTLALLTITAIPGVCEDGTSASDGARLSEYIPCLAPPCCLPPSTGSAGDRLTFTHSRSWVRVRRTRSTPCSAPAFAIRPSDPLPPRHGHCGRACGGPWRALSRQISIGHSRRRIPPSASAIHEQKQWSSAPS